MASATARRTIVPWDTEVLPRAASWNADHACRNDDPTRRSRETRLITPFLSIVAESQTRSRSGGLLPGSAEVPALGFNDVDV
jgi:hypothetical protein